MKRRHFSVTWRILIVNAAVMTMLVVFALYSNDARDKVMALELQNLLTEAQNYTGTAPLPDVIRVDDASTQFFSLRDKGDAWPRTVDDPDQRPDHPRTLMLFDEWLLFLVDLAPLPRSVPSFPPDAGSFRQQTATLPAVGVWRGADGRFIFTAAVRKTASALVAVRTVTVTQTLILESRLNLARFVMVAVGLNFIMAIYLAFMIGNPLNRLAAAAGRFQAGFRRDIAIPDLSHRADEIGDLSQAVRFMVDALRERMDHVQRFAADVAHELKNPLASMGSAASALGTARKPEDIAQLTGIIQQDVGRMDRLITDISHASRLDAELASDDTTVTDLCGLARRAAQRLGGQHPVACDTPNDAITVGVPPGRLEQVIDNLVLNALSFHRGAAPVRVTLTASHDAARLWVDDDGPGIPAGQQDIIFQRFYSERPADHFGRHSGLGLSIVRQIVKAYGGSVVAENRVDGTGAVSGARFTVSLPLAGAGAS